MINQNFTYLGVIIASLGSVSYLVYTLRGKVKPNKITYLLWSVAPIIAFIAETQQGVGIQSLLTFVIGFLPLLIFIASFFNKKSKWKVTNFDILCGALSILGLIFWVITQVGNVAITFSIIADGLAGLPTIIKSYNYPETESGWIYFTGSISAAITILTLKEFSYAALAFPLYYFVMSLVIAGLVQFKIKRFFKN